MGGRLLRQCTAARMVPTGRRASAYSQEKPLYINILDAKAGAPPANLCRRG